jgi:hypothetical protein
MSSSKPAKLISSGLCDCVHSSIWILFPCKITLGLAEAKPTSEGLPVLEYLVALEMKSSD